MEFFFFQFQVKDHCLDTEEGVKSFQGSISGIEFLYLWNSFPQVFHSYDLLIFSLLLITLIL